MWDDWAVLAVVNNGTHFLAEMRGALDRLVLEYEVTSGYREITPAVLGSYSGVILTGGEVHVYEPERLAEVALDEQVLATDIPVLGICLGHQLIAHHYGAEVTPLPHPVDQEEIVELVGGNDPLFVGLPSHILARVAHDDAVTTLPNPLVRLARSRRGENEAIRHRSRPVYGLQFHPEASGEAGLTILNNFATLCGNAGE
jgi:GMP synthase-like glutamine amidotransferase